jgi:hypothetical protein
MRHRHDMPAHRAGEGHEPSDVRARHEPSDVRALDRALAEGVPLHGRSEWLLRSRELCSRSERYELARAFVVIVQTAQHALVDPLTRLNAPAIVRCEGRLLALVALLETDCQFDVQGLALAWLLLEEPGSPLFRTDASQTLEQALDEITAAL